MFLNRRLRREAKRNIFVIELRYTGYSVFRIIVLQPSGFDWSTEMTTSDYDEAVQECDRLRNKYIQKRREMFLQLRYHYYDRRIY